MASPKAALYSTSLDVARRLSLWDSPHPAGKDGRVVGISGAGAGAAGMDWRELLRKFAKHNPSREVVASAASLDLTLHQLLNKHKSTPAPSLSSTLSPPQPLPSSSHPPLSTALASLAAALGNGTGSEFEKNSARIVKAHALYYLGQFNECLRELQGAQLDCPKNGSEGYDLTLRVVGSTIDGHALSQLGRPLEASAAYGRAARAYDEACDLLHTQKGQDVELHKTGEDALFRLCLWEKENSAPQTAYGHHKLYILRAQALARSGSSLSSPFTPNRLLHIHSSFRSLLYTTHSWRDLSLSNQAQEAILQRETKLPLAGDSNQRYLVFLDQVEEGWRRSGAGREGAKEVVEIMYNALTHTFACHRLLRYLARALVALGHYSEAAKALELYLELFSKSKETDPRKVARTLRRFRRAEAGVEVDPDDEKVGETEKEVEDEGESDFDSDEQFIRTAVLAVRVFCRYLDKPDKAVEFAEKARKVFDAENSPLKGDAALESKIEEALGLAVGAQAAKDANPSTRPASHATALSHLQQAHALDPSSWPTLYHLAYQLAELRQIDAALEKARQAIKLPGGAKSREVWHLLGLLASAKGKDWNASLTVLETALDDEDDSMAASPPQVNGYPPQSNGVDLNGVDSRLAGVSQHTSTGLPPFEYIRDETEALEANIQLRITKNIVIEVMEGPESALLDQQGLLAYFSAEFAKISDIPEAAKPSPTATAVPTITETVSKRPKSILGRPKSIRSLRGAGNSLSPDASVGRSNGAASTSRRSLALEGDPSTLSFDDSPGTPSSGLGAGPSLSTNPRATKILVDLWLLSAASYRRAGRLEDAKGAIAEAESLNPDDPDVWVQLAQLHLAKSDLKLARTCLEKALTFSLDHPPALVVLSRLYLIEAQSTPQGLNKKLPFAEGILETLTKTQGWDLPEAWFELSRCFKMMPDGGHGERRKERERECLVWALQLEETRAVRSWSVIPRLL